MAVDALRPELRAVLAATRLRTADDLDLILVSLPAESYAELLGALARLRDPRFQTVVRERGEVTLVVPSDLWAGLSDYFTAHAVYAPWRLITLDITIPLDVYGYLEQVARACASAGAPVLVASGYSTDHLLIHADHYPAARAALQALIDRCRAAAPA